MKPSIKSMTRVIEQLDKLYDVILVRMGKHQGHADQSVHGRGRGGAAPAVSEADRSRQERSDRAKRSHKPSTVLKQRRGYKEQAFIAQITGGKDTKLENHPFDVLFGAAKDGKKGGHGAEVKTIMDNNNDKITMHSSSRKRKEAYAKKNGLTMHTIGVDVRGKNKKYYYKKGVGAFRLSAMERVTLAELKAKFK